MSDPNRTPSRPWAKSRAANVSGALLAILVIILLIVALLPGSFWKWVIVREIRSHTGRSASISGEVRTHLFSLEPSLSLEGLSVANAAWARSVPLLALRRLDVSVRLSSLFHGELIIPHLLLDQPQIDIERDAADNVNFDLSAGKSHATPSQSPTHLPLIQDLRLTEGTLAVSDAQRKLRFDGRFAVRSAAGAPGIGALSVSGQGTLNAKPFQVRADGDPLVKVDHEHPYSLNVALRAADIHLDARIVVTHPFDLGALEATFKLSGADLADVYYLTALALPNTPPYAIEGTLQRNGTQVRIADFRGSLGKSDISGNIEIDTGRVRPLLRAQLKSKELRLADLAAPLGTQTQEHSKTAAPQPAHGAKKKSAATTEPATLLLPDADLQVNRVRAMDADVSYEAGAIDTAKFPVRKLALKLALDDGQLRLNPLAFTLPQGEFRGSVAINARGREPITDLDMRLANVDLSQFKPQAMPSPPLTGKVLGRIKLRGTGASVHKAAASATGDITVIVPEGQMSAAFAELTGIDLRGVGLFLTKSDATVDLRCGVANLHAAGGDFNVNPFIFDTSTVLIKANGNLQMSTEALDFVLRGEPKKVRLVRLRAPITVKGTLAHPQIGVQAGKALAQAGGAAALGAVLTPIAAVLAFVDGGLAKNADCASLLGSTEAQHDIKPTKH